MTFSLKQNFTVNNFWYRVRRTQTSPDMFSHVSKYLDISLLPKTVDFLFRSCNVVAFLLEKWLRRKKCRASVCSPVPTNVRRILTRRKLPTRGSTSYVRTIVWRRRAATAVAPRVQHGSDKAAAAWFTMAIFSWIFLIKNYNETSFCVQVLTGDWAREYFLFFLN